MPFHRFLSPDYADGIEEIRLVRDLIFVILTDFQ
jgi:hypothetical protein